MTILYNASIVHTPLNRLVHLPALLSPPTHPPPLALHVPDKLGHRRCPNLLERPAEADVGDDEEQEFEVELVRELDELEEAESERRGRHEKGVEGEPREGEQRDDEPTVGVEGFAVRGADAEHRRNEDVLERGEEEKRRVLVRRNVELVRVDDGRGVPVGVKKMSLRRKAKEKEGVNEPILRPDEEERRNLESARENDLTDERAENLLRDEVGSRSLRVDARERFRSTHCEKSGERPGQHREMRQKGENVDALVTAIGRMRKRSM